MSTQWAYKVVEISPTLFKGISTEEVQEMLNQHGQQGWELMHVNQLAINMQTFYFKKPK
jgi:hypothetical protein